MFLLLLDFLTEIGDNEKKRMLLYYKDKENRDKKAIEFLDKWYVAFKEKYYSEHNLYFDKVMCKYEQKHIEEQSKIWGL